MANNHLNVDRLRAALVGKTIVEVERLGAWDSTSGCQERMFEVVKLSCSDDSKVFLAAGNDFDSQAFCLPCVVEIDDGGNVVQRMFDGTPYSDGGSWCKDE